jgi:hypothetical protein
VRAYAWRLAFDAFYDQPAEDAEAYLLRWCLGALHSGLEPLIGFVETVFEHWGGIVAWHTKHINTGVLEAINSLVQAAKRRARGLPDEEEPDRPDLPHRRQARPRIYPQMGALLSTTINNYPAHTKCGGGGIFSTTEPAAGEVPPGPVGVADQADLPVASGKDHSSPRVLGAGDATRLYGPDEPAVPPWAQAENTVWIRSTRGLSRYPSAVSGHTCPRTPAG